MQTKEQLLELRASKLAEHEKITEDAKSEKRKLSDEDKKKLDTLRTECKELDKQIEELVADENRSADFANLKGKQFPSVTRQPNGIPEPPEPEPEQRKVTIPAEVVQRSILRSFKGPDSNLRAYKAGRWISALLGHEDSKRWCADQGVEFRAQASNNNFLGGYLIIPEFAQAIIDLRESYGVFRRYAQVWPMGSDTVYVPRRTGGLTAYFVGESDETTASDGTWDQIQLVAKKMGIINRWPSELNSDAFISFADNAASEIAYAFEEKIDRCGFLGDGTSTYGGIWGVFEKINSGSYAGSIVTAATGNTAFDTLDLQDFNKVVGKLPLYARANAKWYISAAGFSSSMERLMYSAGGNTVSNIAGGTGLSFLGYPVVLSQVLNSTLDAQVSTVVALFGDLSKAATLGDRQGVRLDISTERYFEYDQVAIRGYQRFDINVHDLGDATDPGPILAIKTPGA